MPTENCYGKTLKNFFNPLLHFAVFVFCLQRRQDFQFLLVLELSQASIIISTYRERNILPFFRVT